MLRVLCLSGPNLQLLGTREPEIYGTETLDEIHARVKAHGKELGVVVDTRQTNHEGTLCDWIADAGGAKPSRSGKRGAGGNACSGILINAGAYTHTSIALHDAIKAVALPCIEVHLSNPDAREPFRRRSRIAPACAGRVAGFGGDSYVLALVGLLTMLGSR